jgi:hypothetical protein
VGAIEGLRGTLRKARRATTQLPASTPRTRTAALHGLPTNAATVSMKNPPAKLPSRIAAIPSISIQPTASPTFSPASSLAIPHRDGDMMADCRPRRKKPPTARDSECRIAAPQSTIITTSCSQRLALITSRRAWRSANQPVRGAKSTKGATSSREITLTRRLASLAGRSHCTMPIRMSLVALSLKATCACANRKPPKPGRRRRVFIGQECNKS